MNKIEQVQDLLVIGGGINGTGVAADAASRGLNVTLCEMNGKLTIFRELGYKVMNKLSHHLPDASHPTTAQDPLPGGDFRRKRTFRPGYPDQTTLCLTAFFNVTYLGASLLQAMGLQSFPVLLLIGFVFITAIINLLVGGLTSK